MLRSAFVALIFVLSGWSSAWADYTAASQQFYKLTEEQRVLAALWLIGTGDFNGVYRGEYTKRLHAAVESFQTREGFSPTGVLLPDQQARLKTRAETFLAPLGLQRVELSSGGPSLYVPRALFDTETRTSSGYAFERNDKSLSLIFEAIPDQTFEKLYQRFSESRGSRLVSYRVLQPSYFVSAGRFRERYYYTWFNRTDALPTGFTLSWTQPRHDFSGRLTILLANVFKTKRAASAPLAQPEPSFASYSLGPIHLGKPLENDLGAHYICSPLPEFSDTAQCNLKNAASRNSSASPLADTFIKSSDGRILYAYTKSHEAGDFDKVANGITSEISNALRRGMKPRRFSVDGATFAIWGDVNLEEVASGTETYDEVKGLVEQRFGLLVATTGDLDTTKDSYQPVYRVIGGDGLVVIVSQDGRQAVVQRLVVAAGTLAERNFDSQARQFLLRDQTSPADDFSNWPEMAFMIRRLALDTTPENANRIVDGTFSTAARRKYYSHVWAFLPTSVIKHLKDGTYMAVDVFGEKTEFPEIRARIVAQLDAAPAEPFSEFLLYTLGRFGDAIEFNPRSPIHTVLVYASVHSTFRKVMANVFERIAKPGDREFLLEGILYYSYRNKTWKEIPYKEETTEERNAALASRDFFNDHAYEHIPPSNDDYRDNEPSLTQYLNYFNQFPERYDSGPIVLKVADFASLTDALLPQFEDVLKDRKSPHFDDAAYFLGWLAYHRGNVADSLNIFHSLIALIPRDGSDVEHLDYAYLALHQTSRAFRALLPEDALGRVQNSEVLSSESLIWLTVLTSLYNSHQYELVMSGARQALEKFGIRIEDLPVTTDPKRIAATFIKLKVTDEVLPDIVYLYFSSREIDQLEETLSDAANQPESLVEEKIKSLVIKYALTTDPDREDGRSRGGAKPLHKDLRQSLFVARRSLDRLPKAAVYSKLRQWLHYKRIRLLAQFDPIRVAAANSEFRDEFPESVLLDDGMAEQVFAEAVTVGDMVKATATFDSLRQRYPSSNAVDNAYSWLAIGWTCAGQPAKAREIDQQIVDLFPSTRHARYARERLQNPAACEGLLQLYLWDYQAMRWRERNRIETLQAAVKASGVTSTPSR